MEIPMPSSGIEPATFQIVAQYFKQIHHPVRRKFCFIEWHFQGTALVATYGREETVLGENITNSARSCVLQHLITLKSGVTKKQ
jgi:hypothetical protein